MTEQISMLITAGDGPEECNLAVGHVLGRMQDEAGTLDLDLSMHKFNGRNGPKSAVVIVHGPDADAFAKTWIGTIQWRMKSPLRKHHKRSNWFVGVFKLDRPTRAIGTIRKADVTFSALRAGGPGGQHQNTTDSAVRAIHNPTGLTVIVREARSQHRNKSLALERLQALSDAQEAVEKDQNMSNQNQLHRGLERGNPKRCFKGASFKEVK